MSLFFIHQAIGNGPQPSLLPLENKIILPIENQLKAVEPALEGVPASTLRRMSKMVRMAIGLGMPLAKKPTINAIIMSTSDGGNEDCIKFMAQLIQYEEGRLTPSGFV